DPSDSTRHVVALDQGGIELGDRTYYLAADQADVRSKYKAHIAALSQLVLGIPIDADAVLRVETALAAAEVPADARRDPESVYHPMSPAELAALTPSFPWSTFWQATGLAEPTRIDVHVPQYFSALEHVLGSRAMSDMTAYLDWQLVQDRASELDKTVLDE